MIRRLTPWVLGLALATLTTDAAAWKPKTHVYLAEQAADEIVAESGDVYVDYLGDDANTCPGGRCGPYKVDPALLDALVDYRSYYYAGIIGPDAYPDMATGQMNIHPAIARSLDGRSEVGTDAFLRHIYDAAEDACFCYRRKAQLFTRGYLTHAAGDMFAHTLVNHFAGGPFSIVPELLDDTPDPIPNAARHMVLEGYIGTRTPKPLGPAPSVAGLEQWIYETLVRMSPDSDLQQFLFVFPENDPSGYVKLGWLIPRIYSALRNDLQALVDAFGSDDPEKLVYLRGWINAIDEGLREWVRVHAKISDDFIYPPDGNKDFAAAKVKLEVFRVRYMGGMNGLPEALNVITTAVYEIREAALEPIRNEIEEVRELALDGIVGALYPGVTWEEFKRYNTNPGHAFDAIYADAKCPAESITLERFNTEVLKLPGAGVGGPVTFDFRELPAAYNTYVMSKLILLPESEIDRLLADLTGGTAARLERPNVMLGFLQSIDDSRQWKEDAGGTEKQPGSDPLLVFAEHGVFHDIFKRQRAENQGEGRCGN